MNQRPYPLSTFTNNFKYTSNQVAQDEQGHPCGFLQVLLLAHNVFQLREIEEFSKQGSQVTSHNGEHLDHAPCPINLRVSNSLYDISRRPCLINLEIPGWVYQRQSLPGTLCSQHTTSMSSLSKTPWSIYHSQLSTCLTGSPTFFLS